MFFGGGCFFFRSRLRPPPLDSVRTLWPAEPTRDDVKIAQRHWLAHRERGGSLAGGLVVAAVNQPLPAARALSQVDGESTGRRWRSRGFAAEMC